MKYLITGPQGFIGANLTYSLLKQGHQVFGLDKFTYAANELKVFKDLTDEQFKNYPLMETDISYLQESDSWSKNIISNIKEFKPDYVVHTAAESMVDRSLLNNKVFIDSNITGTWAILELLKELPIKKAVFFSTDEVYGAWPSIENGIDIGFKETDKLDPRNPYAATKAAADQLTSGYVHNFGLPICIIRPTNNFGRFQHSEKMIPKTVTNILTGKKVPVYGDGLYTREWLHVSDTCTAVSVLLEKGIPGQTYNVGTGIRHNNLEMIEKICKHLGKISKEVIEFVKDRPGHDKAYGNNSTLIRSLGWKSTKTLETGLPETIEYYKNLI